MTQLKTLLYAAIIVILLPTVGSAVKIPEKLTFDLHWGIIKAGGAVQELREENNGILVTSRAFSADWLSSIYPVDDRVESHLEKEKGKIFGKTLRFRMKTKEGKRLKDREVFFDHSKKSAHYVDHLKKEKLDIPIVPDARDIYSSFQYLRTLKLEVGKTAYLDIVDSRKLWKVEVRVLRKEQIKTIFGKVNTIVVNPMVNSEGVFEKTGAIHIWLTDDERRIPVKMQTKVMIGSITATLVKAE